MYDSSKRLFADAAYNEDLSRLAAPLLFGRKAAFARVYNMRSDIIYTPVHHLLNIQEPILR